LRPTVDMPTKLQCLDLPVVDDADCEAAYPGMITYRMVCAGYMDGGRDVCNVRYTIYYSGFFLVLFVIEQTIKSLLFDLILLFILTHVN